MLFNRSHILQLQHSLDLLERQGITYSSITSEILGGRQYDPHAWGEAVRDKVKANLQRSAYARIKMKGTRILNTDYATNWSGGSWKGSKRTLPLQFIGE